MTEKEPKQKKPLYVFSDRLILKAIGSDSRILNFIALLRKIYRAENINISPLLKNSDSPGYHCFINILDTPPVSSNDQNEEGTR